MRIAASNLDVSCGFLENETVDLPNFVLLSNTETFAPIIT